MEGKCVWRAYGMISILFSHEELSMIANNDRKGKWAECRRTRPPIQSNKNTPNPNLAVLSIR